MRDAVLALLVTVMIPTAGWSWSLAGRLSTLETTQHFLMEQRADKTQMQQLIQKMDKRLTILETLILQANHIPTPTYIPSNR